MGAVYGALNTIKYDLHARAGAMLHYGAEVM
jgi:hypothetical protein